MQQNDSLPLEAIEEFKRLYKARFDIDLNEIKAKRRALNLFYLYKAIYGENNGRHYENK